jgi:hypothetical protein
MGVFQKERRENMRKRSSPGFCIFPEYKWCGPGCSGPGEPINEVDEACREHDLCYQKYGPDCRCDREFLSQLKPHVDFHTRAGRDAMIFYHYMKWQTRFKCGEDKRAAKMKWI